MAQVKTKDELKNIKRACYYTDLIYTKLLEKFNQFTTELDVYEWIVKEITSQKLVPSFDPIVTSSGRAGNEIHPKPTTNKLSGFVIIDFGVKKDGYCSDMTRTVYVGTPTKKEMALYTMILDALTVAELYTTPGLNCCTPDRIVRSFLGDYAKYFIHTLGHGIGKKVHESPKIYAKLTRPRFKEGMVCTLEPGLYIPNYLGIRIENTYIIKQKNAVSLNKSKTQLIVFPKR